MFINLEKFGYKRSLTQAVGFYIAYLILSVVVAGLGGGVIGLIFQPDSLEFSTFIGRFFEMGMVIVLGYLILAAKDLLSDYKSKSLGMLLGSLRSTSCSKA